MSPPSAAEVVRPRSHRPTRRRSPCGSRAGPPLVLVHGSMADHTAFDPFVEALRNHSATFPMDRRGFGASGDGPVYAIERDFEDVSAVVDAVAARTCDSPRGCAFFDSVQRAHAANRWVR